MNHSVRRKMLSVVVLITVVLLPLMLSLWFAHIRAVKETSAQLQSFAQLALNKTERVIQQVDTVRSAAEKYHGQICAPEHRAAMLNIVRSSMYVSDLIYARGDHFLCSSVITPTQSYAISPADYKRAPDIAIYYYRDTPFYAGYKMVYMQRGNYVAVINPLTYSDVASDNPDLAYGIYDTVTHQFFSVSQNAHLSKLATLLRTDDLTFQQDQRFYTIARSENRPIAIIVSTSSDHYFQAFYHQATLTLPLGVIGSVILLLIWSRTRQEFNSPRRMLHRALTRRQLRLHYQPIIDIKNGTCVGAEALLRWPGFNGPVMSPAEFIPLAEKEGMIERITDYVVDELFSDLGDFLAMVPQLYISINLSASDFHSSRLISLIANKAKMHAVRAEQIKIEVTERGFIDVPKTTPVIQAFRQAGYEVAIDDFGTGYSNLHNLYSLNVDILKIDKSFIDTLTTNSTSHLIAEHIIEMAQSLRLKIIAEGVETAEQVTWLLKRGVQFCQGWHFAKALPSQEFKRWVQQPPSLK
ncbi:EAL domain-containing protein [Kosakonia sp. SOY2]|uniref:EAL domain-containing protein n=1 Tax=Kosakonia sp. SOY2 TaxID=3014557 RepID=UPI0022AC22F4|nr:EAL domain-containing protein [Kosakonia sp. SOY2]MCZ3384665.1 EAL domain-containing protein [Kosakonia sp. SOY2]